MIGYVYGAALEIFWKKFVPLILVIMALGALGGYLAKAPLADVEAELKYWRARYPEEHQKAKQNGFKLSCDACLECW